MAEGDAEEEDDEVVEVCEVTRAERDAKGRAAAVSLEADSDEEEGMEQRGVTHPAAGAAAMPACHPQPPPDALPSVGDEQTLKQCIAANASLLKAVKSSDFGALKDILASLKVAGVEMKLKAIAQSKLGHTVSKLSMFEQNSDVRAAASEVKKLWAARAAAVMKPAKKSGSQAGSSSAPLHCKPQLS
jgi:hypothetical protein